MTVKSRSLLSVPSMLLVFCFATRSKQERTLTSQASDLTCVDPDRFYDHTVWTQLESVNHLFCPLDNQSLYLLQSTSDFRIQWSKECQLLNFTTLGHLQSTLNNTTAYLTFKHLDANDAGNYTCTLYLNGQKNASFTVWLVMADLCSVLPKFIKPLSNVTLEHSLGSQLKLNCTVQLPFNKNCDFALHWMKDGDWLNNETQTPPIHWFNDNETEIFISQTLEVNMSTDESYGNFACLVRNNAAVFTLQKSAETAGHLGAVLAALTVVVLLLLVAVMYVKCRLNVLLWYRNRHGELEINDGKLYDAYVSYANSTDDRKFVNFIVKPQLENRHGYKLFLDDKDILPNAEPSADLIMNVSKCRRLIVVLSNAYLEQEWCNSNFREGLWRLLELSRKPTFIAFESQYREIAHPAINLLKQHKNAITLLIWRAGSMVPSSDFWKELCLALPRKVSYQGLRGDPQTHLQEDKDPMLILHSSYLDFRGESHPEGDADFTKKGANPGKALLLAAIRRSYPAVVPESEPSSVPAADRKWVAIAFPMIYKLQRAPQRKLPDSLHSPQIPATGVQGTIFNRLPPPRMSGPDGPPVGVMEEVQLGENQKNEIDISDLGSRNYGARTDFYCLVTEDDM